MYKLHHFVYCETKTTKRNIKVTKPSIYFIIITNKLHDFINCEKLKIQNRSSDEGLN